MKKTMRILTLILFCGFLACMSLLYVLQPVQDFSEREKRYLAEMPAFTEEQILSGQWGRDIEDYLADHMPGRDFFVGLNAYFERITGRQKTKDIWVEEGMLLEAPKSADPQRIEKNMRAINRFAEKVGRNVDFMLIPSAGWYSDLPQYRDGEIIEEIYRQAGEQLMPIHLEKSLDLHSFYNTDHHWNSRGACKAYQFYAGKLGISPREDFRIVSYPGFRGSTYSRSGLWLTPDEPVETWLGSDALTVEIGEECHEGVFYLENLQKEDMYTVYLGGNHPLVRIRNPKKEGKILIIRDSFSNCLGGFLAESFGEVVLVDLRYYKQPVSRLALEESFDHILVCYSLSNFLTDQNLVFLQK